MESRCRDSTRLANLVSTSDASKTTKNGISKHWCTNRVKADPCCLAFLWNALGGKFDISLRVVQGDGIALPVLHGRLDEAAFT